MYLDTNNIKPRYTEHFTEVKSAEETNYWPAICAGIVVAFSAFISYLAVYA